MCFLACCVSGSFDACRLSKVACPMSAIASFVHVVHCQMDARVQARCCMCCIHQVFLFAKDCVCFCCDTFVHTAGCILIRVRATAHDFLGGDCDDLFLSKRIYE